MAERRGPETTQPIGKLRNSRPVKVLLSVLAITVAMAVTAGATLLSEDVTAGTICGAIWGYATAQVLMLIWMKL